MTKEQERWAKRLQKCIGEMPNGIELMIQPSHGNWSTFHVMPEGKVDEMEQIESDRMSIGFAHQQLHQFCCERVFANSESI